MTESPRPSLLTITVVHDQVPFPMIGQVKLQILPRAGDLIEIKTLNGLATYRVTTAKFDANPEAPIIVACLPNAAPNSVPSSPNVDERFEAMAKAQIQILDKAQSYTNAIIVVGYAGAFGIWGFAKPFLSPKAVLAVALLLGFSLCLFVGWEIYGMIQRAFNVHRFHERVADHKSYSESFSGYEQEDRRRQRIYAKLWRYVLPITLAPAIAGVLVLATNIIEELMRR